jgi:hypothetical protein
MQRALAQNTTCHHRSNLITEDEGIQSIMALNWFIKSDTVDGETQDTRHKTEINILSWSSGMSNGGSLMWEVAPERKRSMCRISPLGNGWIAVSLDYVPQSDKGAAGTAVPMAWDIGERKQLAGSSGRRKRGSIQSCCRKCEMRLSSLGVGPSGSRCLGPRDLLHRKHQLTLIDEKNFDN